MAFFQLNGAEARLLSKTSLSVLGFGDRFRFRPENMLPLAILTAWLLSNIFSLMSTLTSEHSLSTLAKGDVAFSYDFSKWADYSLP